MTRTSENLLKTAILKDMLILGALEMGFPVVLSGACSLNVPRITQTSRTRTTPRVSALHMNSNIAELTNISAVQFTLSQIDMMNRLQDLYPKQFSQHVDSSNAYKAFKAGKLISPLGVEGLHQIGNKVSNLRLYRDLGVRYATLTHNCHNKFADAALVEEGAKIAEPLWGGVSPLGQKLVHEMNRIGMIVDLAHVRYVSKPVPWLLFMNDR